MVNIKIKTYKIFLLISTCFMAISMTWAFKNETLHMLTNGIMSIFALSIFMFAANEISKIKDKQ